MINSEISPENSGIITGQSTSVQPASVGQHISPPGITLQKKSKFSDAINEKLIHIVAIIVEKINPQKIILLSPPDKTPKHADPRFNYINVLVLTAKKTRERNILQRRIEKHCFKLDILVNVFIHTIGQFNTMLINTPQIFPEANFESDFLYSANTKSLVKRHVFNDHSFIRQTEAYFYTWFPMAQAFYLSSAFILQRNEFQVAAFLLRKALVCAYTAVHLVFTSYKPQTSSLDQLCHYTSRFSLHLTNVFPKSEKNNSHFFDLLKTACSNPLNNKYPITQGECILLSSGVWSILEVANNICKKRIQWHLGHSEDL